MSKVKVELTPEVIGKAIEDGKFASMTQLAHGLGYKGSVSSSLTKKFHKLIVGIDDLLAANKTSKPVKDAKDTPAVAAPTKSPTPAGNADKPAKVKTQKPAKSTRAKGGKYPHDPRNPFREGSNYSLVFNVLASFPAGVEKTKLVELVAAASGKDLVHAGYDCQVLLSAKGNEQGLSRNDGPRHRSCRPGFWIDRNNSHVKLVVDKR